jgi:ribonucleotide reductase beta subunit family protein with ferritin-like domain
MHYIETIEPAAVRVDSLKQLKQFYRAAKKRTWTVEGLGWNDLPPVPGMEDERWRMIWASVVKQQLQADIIAVEASTQLLLAVPETEARMYYSTMVQDEGKHVEGWTQLVNSLDNVEAHNPYLEELGEMILDRDLIIEQKVVGFQVVFEGAVIPAFKDISESARKTVLGEMSSRLIRDDSIHHHSGVAYAEYLFSKAPPSLKKDISRAAAQYLPVYLESITWRPPARRWLDRFMKERDRASIDSNKLFIAQALSRLGIPVPFDI